MYDFKCASYLFIDGIMNGILFRVFYHEQNIIFRHVHILYLYYVSYPAYVLGFD